MPWPAVGDFDMNGPAAGRATAVIGDVVRNAFCGTHAKIRGSACVPDANGPAGRRPLLHQLRQLAQQLGLARSAGRRITLSARGRRLLADPEKLWRAVSAGLLAGGADITTFAGVLFLAVLPQADSLPGSEITATVRRAPEEEGFRDDRARHAGGRR